MAEEWRSKQLRFFIFFSRLPLLHSAILLTAVHNGLELTRYDVERKPRRLVNSNILLHDFTVQKNV